MLMPRSEVVTIRTVEDIQRLVEKEDSEKHKQIAKMVAKVIRAMTRVTEKFRLLYQRLARQWMRL